MDKQSVNVVYYGKVCNISVTINPGKIVMCFLCMFGIQRQNRIRG